MRHVKDINYPTLETFLCYSCGYSIDDCLIENVELLEAYERLYHRFQNVLKPKDLARYQPTGNTDNKPTREHNLIEGTVSLSIDLLTFFKCFLRLMSIHLIHYE